MTELGRARESDLKPWRLEWQPEHIRRFWDWMGSNPAQADKFFAKMVSDQVLAQALPLVGAPGRVLDLGCGPGFFVQALVRRGIRVVAADTSPESIRVLDERMRGNPCYEGGVVSTVEHVPLPDESVDTVMLLETVEHLSAEVSRVVLAEARRIVKPGGAIVVTTRNEEDLRAAEVVCPNCACVYHPVQHVRSLSAGTLVAELRMHGFEPVKAMPTLFATRKGVMGLIQRWRYPLLGQKYPHLLYVGRRAA